jgi:hypothetical protein
MDISHSAKTGVMFVLPSHILRIGFGLTSRAGRPYLGAINETYDSVSLILLNDPDEFAPHRSLSYISPAFHQLTQGKDWLE